MVSRKTPQIHPPAGRPNDGNPAALVTVVGRDARFQGKFTITDSIQIDCSFGGELKVGGKLVIGERGSVRADVQTVDAIIHGEYEGKMMATGSVEVTGTARVHGCIETNALAISKGGVFTGNVVKLKESEAERGTPPVQLVEETAEPLLPLPLHDEVFPEDPHPDEAPHGGERPGRGEAGRNQGSSDTVPGAGMGQAADDKGFPRAAAEEAAGGHAERGGEPEPGGPLAGTSKRRDRVRPGAQARPKKKGKTSHDHGTMVKLKESKVKGRTPSVSAVEEMAGARPLPPLRDEVFPEDPHPGEAPHVGERPGRGEAGRNQGSSDTVPGAGMGQAADDKGFPRAAGEEAAGGHAERGGEPEPGGPLAGTSKRRDQVRPGAQAGPKKKGNTSHDHGTMVKLKESKAMRRTPSVCAVDEMAKRPLALWDKGLPGYPPQGGGSEDRPGDQGSSDTVPGAGAGHGVEEVPRGRAERGGEPEPGGPLVGTPEPRDRVRAGAQMRAKKQLSTSHDRGIMVKLKTSKAKRHTPSVSVVEEMADPLPLPLLQEEMRRGQSRPDGDPHLGDRPGQGDRGAGRDQGSGDSVRGAGAGHGVEEVPRGRAERGGEPEPGGPLVGMPERWARVQPVPQAGPKGQGNASDDVSGDKKLGVTDEAASPPHDDPLGIR